MDRHGDRVALIADRAGATDRLYDRLSIPAEHPCPDRRIGRQRRVAEHLDAVALVYPQAPLGGVGAGRPGRPAGRIGTGGESGQARDSVFGPPAGRPQDRAADDCEMAAVPAVMGPVVEAEMPDFDAGFCQLAQPRSVRIPLVLRLERRLPRQMREQGARAVGRQRQHRLDGAMNTAGRMIGL